MSQQTLFPPRFGRSVSIKSVTKRCIRKMEVTVVRKWGERDGSGIRSSDSLPAEHQAECDLCQASRRLSLNFVASLFPLQNYSDIMALGCFMVPPWLPSTPPTYKQAFMETSSSPSEGVPAPAGALRL